jgi:hypothetical protein
MLRKTLVTLTAVAALGVGSTAMARMGGGGGGGWGGNAHVGNWGGGGGWGGNAHVGGSAMHGIVMGHPMHGAPMTTAMALNPNHFAWGHDHFHNHFHHRFHNRFFAFGFGGPYLYDYAYNCWSRVPTRYGWQWIYVCGDEY